MSPKPMYASEGAVDAPLMSNPPVLADAGSPATDAPAVVWTRRERVWAKVKALDVRLGQHIPQWKRMLFHMWGISTAAALCLVLDDPYVRGGLTIFCLLLALAYEYGRKFPATRFGRLCNKAEVRSHEVGTRAASTDFGVAMAIVAMFFAPAVGATAFLVAGWADPIARFFGQRFGRRRWFGGKKTVEGSLAGFVAAAGIIALSGLTASLSVAVATAAVAMAVELIPERIVPTRLGPLLTPVDNFYIPVCTAATLAALI